MIRDITGLNFNRLTCIKFIRKDKWNAPYWLFKCICGKEKIIRGHSVSSGSTKSCGCLHLEIAKITQLKNRKTHGKHDTRVYKIYLGMKARCYNQKHAHYLSYGGRGITMSKEWQKFEKFYKDMGDPPSPKHSIDRVDNNKGYSKENCRWSTQKEQANNTRANRHITFNGETKTLSQWADFVGLNQDLLWSRLKNGWPLEKAFTQPVRGFK